MITLFALGLAVGVALSVGILAIFQLKAVSRNQTGIESWIVAKMTIRHTDVHNISLRIELLLAVLFIRRPDNFTLSQELFWANVWRKDIGEKKPFRYPYDLGKLVNFQQVGTYSKIDLKLFIFADYFIHYFVIFCQLEQIYQKRLKQKIQRTFKITQNYDGSRCMCFRYGCLTAIRSPCFEEPRISVRVGDALMVTRGTK
ncbi:palmitoyltransferase ZDHHC6 [Schistosoma bovis]|uniref:Palmitoyltransferase ZDHHC6 n=1 Tax=Schistosoma bovis TaxID=6184 RepID=A0A430QPR7_SCHBO|nr:palmitoyltransferase ZDHHC6 [Schistosoma bovis]